MATLEELLAEGIRKQGYTNTEVFRNAIGHLILYVDCWKVDLAELADFLSAYVVIGGRSKENQQ